MSKLGKRHVPGLIILLILLGIVVPPFVNVGRYRAYIAETMSRALGRPVAFDNISLRLLPQPGFDIQNLTVGDDPAYSAEPILRSEEVTAILRMSSLWRGRLEIARLSFKYPSLNLVRRAEGDWNVESLAMLERLNDPGAMATILGWLCASLLRGKRAPARHLPGSRSAGRPGGPPRRHCAASGSPPHGREPAGRLRAPP